MKFLFQDHRTRSHLQRWSSGDLVVAGFFFLERGARSLQKSQLGLFRAIFYQLLNLHRKLIRVVVPERWEEAYASTDPTSKLRTPRPEPTKSNPWSLPELKAAFENFAKLESVKLGLCLLIDGLDEFNGDYDNIIESLRSLTRPPTSSSVRVKLCVSSRPLIVFDNAFRQCRSLRLQDLTFNDIKLYVNSKMQANHRMQELVELDPKTSSLFVGQVVTKASGVFLWVYLVVESLLQGLRNYDRISDLQIRLESLPETLEDLYWRMVSNIDKVYQEQASRFFQIVQSARMPLTTLGLSFAEEDPMCAITPPIGTMTEDERSFRCKEIEGRLKSRCAGLIEIQAHMAKYEGKVQFLHLSVKDFLRKKPIENWLLEQTKGTYFDPNVCILSSYLRQITLLPGQSSADWGGSASRSRSLIFESIYHALQAEKTTGRPQTVFLDELDRQVSIRSTKNGSVFGWSPLGH
jgi:hypothetical protein